MRAHMILFTISNIAANKVAVLFANKTIASTVSPEDSVYPVLFPLYRSRESAVSNFWTSDASFNCATTSKTQLELNCTLTNPIADAIFENADQRDLYVEIIYQDFNDAFRQNQNCGPWGRVVRPINMLRETRIATSKGSFRGWQPTHYQTFVHKSQKYPKLDIAYHC